MGKTLDKCNKSKYRGRRVRYFTLKKLKNKLHGSEISHILETYWSFSRPQTDRLNNMSLWDDVNHFCLILSRCIKRFNWFPLLKGGTLQAVLVRLLQPSCIVFTRFIGHLPMLYQLQIIKWQKMIMYGKPERMEEKTVMIYFKEIL